ncbi:gyf domain protein [Cystoisospora suis]|uniref:Gyf domain protein n=1 Tax=Cystoisospora suis TaxID=483139 RepID=A0A2C6KH16_9APIC|nr:gyf domain protein [Cystoisospora suis]
MQPRRPGDQSVDLAGTFRSVFTCAYPVVVGPSLQKPPASDLSPMLVRPLHPVALRPPLGPPAPAAFVVGPPPHGPVPVAPPHPIHGGPIPTGLPGLPGPAAIGRPPAVYGAPQPGPGFPDGPARAVVLVDGPPPQGRPPFHPERASGRPPPSEAAGAILLPPRPSAAPPVRPSSAEVLSTRFVVSSKGPESASGHPPDSRRQAEEGSGGTGVFLAPATGRVPGRPPPYADDRRGPPPPSPGPVLSLHPGPGARRPFREGAHPGGLREGGPREPPSAFGRDDPGNHAVPDGFPRRSVRDVHPGGEVREEDSDVRSRPNCPRLEPSGGHRPPPRGEELRGGMVKGGPSQELRDRCGLPGDVPVLLPATGERGPHPSIGMDGEFRSPRRDDSGGGILPRGDMPPRAGGAPPQAVMRGTEGRPLPPYDAGPGRGYSSPPVGGGYGRPGEHDRAYACGQRSGLSSFSPEDERRLGPPGRFPVENERGNMPSAFSREGGAIASPSSGMRDGGRFPPDPRDQAYVSERFPRPGNDRGRPPLSAPGGQDCPLFPGRHPDERMRMHPDRERALFGQDRERAGGSVPPPSSSFGGFGSHPGNDMGYMQPFRGGDERGPFPGRNSMPGSRYPCESGRGGVGVPPRSASPPPDGGRRGDGPPSFPTGERERGPMGPPEFGEGPPRYFARGGGPEGFPRPAQMGETRGDLRRGANDGEGATFFRGSREGGPAPPNGPIRRGDLPCSGELGPVMRSEGGSGGGAFFERRENFKDDKAFEPRGGFPPFGSGGGGRYLNNERAGPREFSMQQPQQWLSLATGQGEGQGCRDDRKGDESAGVGGTEQQPPIFKDGPFNGRGKPTGKDAVGESPEKRSNELSREGTSNKLAGDGAESLSESKQARAIKVDEGGEKKSPAESPDQADTARKTDGASRPDGGSTASASLSLSGSLEGKPGEFKTVSQEESQGRDSNRSCTDSGEKSVPKAGGIINDQPSDNQKGSSTSPMSPPVGSGDEKDHSTPKGNDMERGNRRMPCPPPGRNDRGPSINRHDGGPVNLSDNSRRVFPPPPGDAPPQRMGQGPPGGVSGEGLARCPPFGNDPNRIPPPNGPPPSLLGRGYPLDHPPSRGGPAVRGLIMNGRDERPLLGERPGPLQNGNSAGEGAQWGSGPQLPDGEGGNRSVRPPPPPSGPWVGGKTGEKMNGFPRYGPPMRGNGNPEQAGSLSNDRAPPPFMGPHPRMEQSNVNNNARGPPGFQMGNQEASPLGARPGFGENNERPRGPRGPFPSPRPGLDNSAPFSGVGSAPENVRDRPDFPHNSKDRFEGPGAGAEQERDREPAPAPGGMPPYLHRGRPDSEASRPPGNWGTRGGFGPRDGPPTRETDAGSSSFHHRGGDRAPELESFSPMFNPSGPAFQGDQGCTRGGRDSHVGGSRGFSSLDTKATRPYPSHPGDGKNSLPPSRGEEGPMNENNRMPGLRPTDHFNSSGGKSNTRPPPPPPPPPTENQRRGGLAGGSPGGPSRPSQGGEGTPTPDNAAAATAAGLFNMFGQNRMASSASSSEQQGPSNGLQPPPPDPFQALLMMQAAAAGGGAGGRPRNPTDSSSKNGPPGSSSTSSPLGGHDTPHFRSSENPFAGGGSTPDLQQFYQQLQQQGGGQTPQQSGGCINTGGSSPPGNGFPGGISQQGMAGPYAAALSALLGGAQYNSNSTSLASDNRHSGQPSSGMSPNQFFEQLQQLMLGKQASSPPNLTPQGMLLAAQGAMMNNPGFLASLFGRGGGGGYGQQQPQQASSTGGGGTRPTGGEASAPSSGRNPSNTDNAALAWGMNTGMDLNTQQWQALLASQLFGRPDLATAQGQQNSTTLIGGNNPFQQFLLQQAQQQQFNSPHNSKATAPPNGMLQDTPGGGSVGQGGKPSQSGNNQGAAQTPEAFAALMSQGGISPQQNPFLQSIVQAMGGGGISGLSGGAGQTIPGGTLGMFPGVGQSSGGDGAQQQQNAFLEFLKQMGFPIPQSAGAALASAGGTSSQPGAGPDVSSPPVKTSQASKDDGKEKEAHATPSKNRLLQELSKVDPAMLNPAANREAHTWWYLDNSNQCQGPFDTLQMLRWFDGGFFDPQRPLRRDDEAGFTPLADGKRLTEVAARIINTSRQATGPNLQGQAGAPFSFFNNPNQVFGSRDMSLEAKVQHAQVALAPLFMMAKKQQNQDRQQMPLPQNKRRKFQ